MIRSLLDQYHHSFGILFALVVVSAGFSARAHATVQNNTILE